jgi:hypothetical protein
MLMPIAFERLQPAQGGGVAVTQGCSIHLLSTISNQFELGTLPLHLRDELAERIDRMLITVGDSRIGECVPD